MGGKRSPQNGAGGVAASISQELELGNPRELVHVSSHEGSLSRDRGRGDEEIHVPNALSGALERSEQSGVGEWNGWTGYTIVMPIESSSACSLPASVFVTAPHRRRAHTERRRSRQAARSRFRPRMRMPDPAFLATFLVTNLRETRYPDESQLRCPGFAAPPSTDLSFDGIDGTLAHSQPFDHAL